VTFLLLFPSGARRGKLQAIPFKNFSSDRAWSHIILAPDLVFLSRLALGLVSLVFFWIPVLTSGWSLDMVPGKKLCPVCTGKAYCKSQSLGDSEEKPCLTSSVLRV